MQYSEAIDFLFNSTPLFQNSGSAAYKPGLETTAALSAAFGNPHYGLPCIIVGGTNGKGSTSHTIAAALQSAGYRTGLFTSPHLIDFRERIRVDGKEIPEESVTEFVEEYLAMDCSRTLSPSFFEFTTVMALRYFRARNVDIAVLEVGLGGRLDCTNICDPMLSVITNISLDHTDLLGRTEAAIASEKAGIMRPGRLCIAGRAEGDVLRVFQEKALACGAVLRLADKTAYASADRQADCIIYRGTVFGDIRGELCGDCQEENAATILTALAALRSFYPRLDATAVALGFSSVCRLTGLRGRWETLEKEPVRIICDTGHNIGGWRYLGPRLASAGPLHMVLGFVGDKDVEAIMDEMPKEARYYFTAPSVRRGRPACETAAIASGHGLRGETYGSVAEAFAAARACARKGETIFVGGSTFVVADLLASLKK